MTKLGATSCIEVWLKAPVEQPLRSQRNVFCVTLSWAFFSATNFKEGFSLPQEIKP